MAFQFSAYFFPQTSLPPVLIDDDFTVEHTYAHSLQRNLQQIIDFPGIHS